jgi:NAD(P)-dependent dehydrogenase (short-subunit alcohol dehydrogenase family)
MMTKTMAPELAGQSIRANLVAPGAIMTEMNREIKENKEEMERIIKNFQWQESVTPMKLQILIYS